MHSAVFLDRDGTIIRDVGHINNSLLVEFYPFTFTALKKLQMHFLLFIITNQSGISKGIVTEDDVIMVNNYIMERLKLSNIIVHDIFYCPHKSEDNCDCKKPSPFFIYQAADLYNIDLSTSFMVGDHPSDVECAINAGVTPIYLLTGHGTKHQSEVSNSVNVCGNIMEAS